MARHYGVSPSRAKWSEAHLTMLHRNSPAIPDTQQLLTKLHNCYSTRLLRATVMRACILRSVMVVLGTWLICGGGGVLAAGVCAGALEPREPKVGNRIGYHVIASMPAVGRTRHERGARLTHGGRGQAPSEPPGHDGTVGSTLEKTP